MHITYGISNMKNLEASNITKVTIYKKEKEKRKKKTKEKKEKIMMAKTEETVKK